MITICEQKKLFIENELQQLINKIDNNVKLNYSAICNDGRLAKEIVEIQFAENCIKKIDVTATSLPFIAIEILKLI